MEWLDDSVLCLQVTCLQFCANRIVSGSDDNTLRVWNAITGKVSKAVDNMAVGTGRRKCKGRRGSEKGVGWLGVENTDVKNAKCDHKLNIIDMIITIHRLIYHLVSFSLLASQDSDWSHWRSVVFSV